MKRYPLPVFNAKSYIRALLTFKGIMVLMFTVSLFFAENMNELLKTFNQTVVCTYISDANKSETNM